MAFGGNKGHVHRPRLLLLPVTDSDMALGGSTGWRTSLASGGSTGYHISLPQVAARTAHMGLTKLTALVPPLS